MEIASNSSIILRLPFFLKALLDKVIIGIFRLIVFLGPYKLKIAKSQKEIDLACKLRRKIFAKEGVSSLEVPIRDEYDAHSVFFLCYYKDELVGTYRQILPKGKFQALKAFNVLFPKNIDQDTCSELSGLVIKQRHRWKSRIPLWGLLWLSHQYAIKNNIFWWIGIANPRLVDSYNAAGGNLNLMKELPLEEAHFRARDRFPMYYQKHPNAKVFYLKVSTYSPSTWTKNQMIRLLPDTWKRKKIA